MTVPGVEGGEAICIWIGDKKKPSRRNLYEKRRHSLHRKRMVTDAAQTAPEVATGAA
jgi:hypothetical protein